MIWDTVESSDVFRDKSSLQDEISDQISKTRRVDFRRERAWSTYSPLVQCILFKLTGLEVNQLQAARVKVRLSLANQSGCLVMSCLACYDKAGLACLELEYIMNSKYAQCCSGYLHQALRNGLTEYKFEWRYCLALTYRNILPAFGSKLGDKLW